MTLIDVDGYLPPDELAVLGAAKRREPSGASTSAARSASIFRLAGGKAARQAAAAAIDAALPQPFERTAVNGFGFVQIVRPRSRASLVELAQDRAAFEARALLRRAAFEAAGRQAARRPSGGDRRARRLGRTGSRRSRGRSAARSSLRADACPPHVWRICRSL